MRIPPPLQAISAAALFGLSVPLAKKLGIAEVPLIGTALLYGGAGLGLLATLGAERALRMPAREASLRFGDVSLLAAIILLGGLVGPCLQLFGIARTAGSTASLLLNLEVVFTVLVAVAFFREHMGGREIAAAGLVLAGAAWLSAGGGPERAGASLVGALAVAGSCLAWAFDNNLTQKLSARDPRAITACKGLGAGGTAALLALATHESWPAPRIVLLGLLLGAVSYGSSLVLYVRALRGLGAARTGALFATAPFVGAITSFVLLGERPGLLHLGAGALMATGVLFLFSARHDHEHVHEAMDHDHQHVHDEHHRHDHQGDEGPEPHSHPHHHTPLRHAHPHAPDVHHRHQHGKRS